MKLESGSSGARGEDDGAAPRSLESLAPGSSAKVAGIDGDAAIALILMEIGLSPGVVVTVIRRAPLGCPLEVSVGGARFAIRKETARHVSLEDD